ncbi:MAG: glycosyltransferase [Victivallaceae bacterium]|nr:glycosyltransferase [Victivallaceae bacterium]
MKLVISCGGTGGHFYPGLSIARRLRERGGEVVLLLSGINSTAQTTAARAAGITAEELPPMPNPYGIANFLHFARGFCGGYRNSSRMLRDFKPDAYLGMGSFTSLPTLIAARRRRIPIFLHDGNARIGRANRVLSRYARLLFGAYAPVNRGALHCGFELSGMPLRPELAEFKGDRAEAAAKLNKTYEWDLDPSKVTILVMGGSQGARTINLSTAAAVSRLSKINRNFQLIHLCGGRLLKETEQLYNTLDCKVFIQPLSVWMAELYTVADAVVSRAGGSSVAEMSSFGRYGVLCPYPFAAELHQNDNAAAMAATGAAEIIENSALSEDAMFEILSRLISAPEEYRKRGEQGKTGLHRAAADFIIDRIEASLQ